MHNPRNTLHIRNRPRNIRRMRTSHHSRPLRHQPPQLVRIADGIRSIRRSPPLHGQIQPLRDPLPRSRVGLVVEFGENELVAGLEVKGCGEVVDELGR